MDDDALVAKGMELLQREKRVPSFQVRLTP